MSYFRKKLERRTYSQDRYYTLIKRQKAGQATFNDLVELDEIVNRVPDIREIVIREQFGIDNDETGEQPNNPGDENSQPVRPPLRQNLWSRLTSFLKQLFTAHTQAISQKFGIIY